MISDGSTIPTIPQRHRLRPRKRELPITSLPQHRRSGHTTNKLHNGRFGITVACLVVTVLALSSFRSLDGKDASSGVERRFLQAVEPMMQTVHHDVPEAPVESTLQQVQQMEEDEEEDSTYNEISNAEIEEVQAMNRMLIEGLAMAIEGLTQVPDFDTAADFQMETPAQHFNRDPVQQQQQQQQQQQDPSVDSSPSEQSNTSSTAQKTDYESLISSASTPLPKYTLPSLLQQIQHYSHTFTILIYDPADDTFYALYSKKHHWASANEKMMKALKSVTYLIRMLFPEKLVEELAIGISSGDCEFSVCFFFYSCLVF